MAATVVVIAADVAASAAAEIAADAAATVAAAEIAVDAAATAAADVVVTALGRDAAAPAEAETAADAAATVVAAGVGVTEIAPDRDAAPCWVASPAIGTGEAVAARAARRVRAATHQTVGSWAAAGHAASPMAHGATRQTGQVPHLPLSLHPLSGHNPSKS